MEPNNSLSNKIKFFSTQFNPRRCIFIIIVFLIIIGSFLRVYGLNEVYTEYDDIGVVSVHKGSIGTKIINPLEQLKHYSIDIDYQLKVDMESFHSVENSMLFPFYIGYNWTYAPAQYILFPLLINTNDKFDEVVFKGRLISAIFSIAGICLLAYLMYVLNGRLLTWVIPIVLTIPIFSANSILYAHHMSPYSAYFFSSSLGLFLLYQYFISKISFRKIVILLSLLFYLSYLTILFALPVFVIYLFKLRENSDVYFSKMYKSNLISLLIGFVITFPGLLILKTKSGGGKGILSPEFKDISSLIDIAFHLLRQIYVSLESIIYGVVRHDYLFILMLFSIGFLLITKLVIGYKDLSKTRIYIVSIFCILLQWIILHLFGALPLDETRHMLPLLPFVCIVVFYVLKDIKIWSYSIASILFITLVSFSSSIYSINLVESKYSNFDYNLLDSRDEKVIFLYHSTLGPLNYFDKSEKKAYALDFNSFKNHYSEMEFPDEILLVSQRNDFSEHIHHSYKKSLPGLFCNYSIKTLYEKDSDGIYFTYNNYGAHSTPNNMFVYQMRKTSVNQC